MIWGIENVNYSGEDGNETIEGEKIEGRKEGLELGNETEVVPVQYTKCIP